MGLLGGLSDRARTAVANWAKSVSVSEPGPIGFEDIAVPAVTTFVINGREITLDFNSILGQSVEQLWVRQPNLRAVINFLARNVAQLSLHVFDRVADNDRTRMTSGPVYDALKKPNDHMTQYELITSLVSSLALYDIAYWWVHEGGDGWIIEPLPVSWVTPVQSAVGTSLGRSVSSYRVTWRGNPVVIPADEVLVFHGWNPGDMSRGCSPVEALKATLAEQLAAVAWRQQRWDKGARVGTYLYRPPTAPGWSEAAQQRFTDEWRDKWGARGPDAGGEPLLQDGMELRKVGFTAREDEYVDAGKLAVTTIASVYHVNPVMLGMLDNANYSNVLVFRRMLYGDTLGPTMAMIQDRMNAFLLPRLGAGPDEYVEFNVAAKLQGSFEEQAAVMSTMVGRPIMTANEGRARFNLPRIDSEDADQLIVPLNVAVGGQPSPQTPTEVPTGGGSASAPGEPAQARPAPPVLRIVKDATPAGKARPTDTEHADLEAALVKFFGRQSRSVLSALGNADDPLWWDGERWDTELGADLYQHALAVSSRVGAAINASYNTKQTEAYLTKLAEIRAANINAATLTQIEAALEDDSEDNTPTTVFEDAKQTRAPQIAVTVLTAVAGFGAVEAGKQAGGESTKTWRVTSSKPRPEHAKMNGETVAVQDTFSNGADWPGDPVLGADGVAGCQCDVEITLAG